jgi:hypothetical protein
MPARPAKAVATLANRPDFTGEALAPDVRVEVRADLIGELDPSWLRSGFPGAPAPVRSSPRSPPPSTAGRCGPNWSPTVNLMNPPIYRLPAFWDGAVHPPAADVHQLAEACPHSERLGAWAINFPHWTLLGDHSDVQDIADALAKVLGALTG